MINTIGLVSFIFILAACASQVKETPRCTGELVLLERINKVKEYDDAVIVQSKPVYLCIKAEDLIAEPKPVIPSVPETNL